VKILSVAGTVKRPMLAERTNLYDFPLVQAGSKRPSARADGLPPRRRRLGIIAVDPLPAIVRNYDNLLKTLWLVRK
jgi:hypothetical protein